MSEVISRLAYDWKTAGVEVGDTLMVHSSIKRTLLRFARQKVKLTPEDIMMSFLSAVGPSGTVLFPLFNFDFTKGAAFDIRKTMSRMGALTEAARLHPDSVRTGHPMYSFAVLGHKATQFRDVDNKSGYGPDSPFAILRAQGGKIAVLDLPDQKSMTFYHHVEEMHAVDYRYHKNFTGDYTDMTGNTEKRTYSIYVRDIEKNVQTHVDPAGELMWREGLYVGNRPHEGAGLRTICASDMYDYVSGIIMTGKAKNLLYKTD